MKPEKKPFVITDKDIVQLGLWDLPNGLTIGAPVRRGRLMVSWVKEGRMEYSACLTPHALELIVKNYPKWTDEESLNVLTFMIEREGNTVLTVHVLAGTREACGSIANKIGKEDFTPIHIFKERP